MISEDEMQLTIDDRGDLIGEIRGRSGTKAKVTGRNVGPGQLRLSLPGQGTFAYRKLVCGKGIGSIYRTGECGLPAWIASNAPTKIAEFSSCVEYGENKCKLFSDHETQDQDAEMFVSESDWGEFLADPFTHRSYEKGPGNIAFATFKAGTFLGSVNEVIGAKHVIMRTLESRGLRVIINQGRRGPTDFLVTIVGRSPQLDFPDGYWFKIQLQMACIKSPESRAPEGIVEYLQVEGIDTKVFRGPANANPLPDQFRSLSFGGKQNWAIEVTVNLEVMSILTNELGGTITSPPGGL
jgi:hypothetical protein